MDEWSQQIPRLKAMSDYGDDAIKFADYKKWYSKNYQITMIH
jgi:hypothetical protein